MMLHIELMKTFSAAFRGHMDGAFRNQWEGVKDGEDISASGIKKGLLSAAMTKRTPCLILLN